MSNYTDGFDIEELHALVDRVLQNNDQGQANESTSLPLGFGLGDTSLFELFHAEISKVYTEDKTIEILDRVREQYVSQYKTSDFNTLHTLIKHCKKCPAMRHDPIPPLGNSVDPDIVFVYDRPIYSGDTFKAWHDILQDIGFDKTKLFHTAIARCTPVDKRNFSTDEISMCTKSYLFNEIQLLSPKLIILSGLSSAKVFLGDIETLNDHRGSIHWLGPWALMPVHSFSYAEKSGQNAVIGLHNDLKTAYNFCYQ